MDDEKKYPFMDEEDNSCLKTNEPAIVSRVQKADIENVDHNFGFKDFGYPKTLEELNTVLDQVDAYRNNPNNWITSIEFHNRLEKKYPWLRKDGAKQLLSN